MEIIRTRAPLRVSFAGGGTDVEPYCSEHGGACLALSIQRYAYASSHITPHSRIEKTIHYFLGRVVHIENNIPPMSGLGGSASCFVAGIKVAKPELSTDMIAKLAFHLERNVMGIAGGKQDQYMAAYGGLLKMDFGIDIVDIEPIEIPPDFTNLLLLVYMGERSKHGADIIKDQMSRDNEDNFRLQKVLVRDMCLALKQNNLIDFGALLDHAWTVKLRYSPLIADDRIKEFYKTCSAHGAIGGKLTGAGGGGYMLLMEHPEKRNILRDYLKRRGVEYLDVVPDLEGVTLI